IVGLASTNVVLWVLLRPPGVAGTMYPGEIFATTAIVLLSCSLVLATRVDESDTPRSSLIIIGGFDSILEELYFFGAPAALEHGDHCLTFDGPGQGRVIRQQSLPYRPDWEAVVSPVVEYALSRPKIDPNHLALMGVSLGGYLALRAAAFEPRIKALIAYDGIFDCFSTVDSTMPSALLSLLEHSLTQVIDTFLQVISTLNPGMRWSLSNGMWTYNVQTTRAFQ